MKKVLTVLILCCLTIPTYSRNPAVIDSLLLSIDEACSERLKESILKSDYHRFVDLNDFAGDSLTYEECDRLRVHIEILTDTFNIFEVHPNLEDSLMNMYRFYDYSKIFSHIAYKHIHRQPILLKQFIDSLNIQDIFPKCKMCQEQMIKDSMSAFIWFDGVGWKTVYIPKNLNDSYCYINEVVPSEWIDALKKNRNSGINIVWLGGKIFFKYKRNGKWTNVFCNRFSKYFYDKGVFDEPTITNIVLEYWHHRLNGDTIPEEDIINKYIRK